MPSTVTWSTPCSRASATASRWIRARVASFLRSRRPGASATVLIAQVCTNGKFAETATRTYACTMQLPEDAPMSDHLAVLFGQMSRAIARDRGTLTPSEYSVISLLDHAGPRRVCDLAEADGPDASTVSRRVAALADRDLVARTPDPQDRRAHRITLTDRGRAVL